MQNQIREVMRKNGRKYTIRLHRNRIFLPSEWIKFYESLRKQQKFTFNFLINTGARIMEAQNVRVREINFKEKYILLTKVKTRNAFSTGKPRKIPISNKFIKNLKRLIREKNLSYEDKLPILSNPAANICMKNHLRKSGFEDWRMFSLHNIRKSLESWLVCLNVNPLKILSQFGHNQTTALKYYINFISEHNDEKEKIRKIIGNLYYGNGEIDNLNDRISRLENDLNSRH